MARNQSTACSTHCTNRALTTNDIVSVPPRSLAYLVTCILHDARTLSDDLDRQAGRHRSERLIFAGPKADGYQTLIVLKAAIAGGFLLVVLLTVVRSAEFRTWWSERKSRQP